MSDLPSNVRRFIADHLNSVEQLEVLLLLRSDPQRVWTASEVSSELVSTPDAAALRLADLEEHGLISSEDGPVARYRYGRPSRKLESDVSAVATAYEKRRVKVISEIFSGPATPAESFSDAFRLWRDQDG
jgi:predicted ArsR family transcriptional regulator